MIYTLTLNPAIDRTILVDAISKKDVTRVSKSIKQAAGKGINISMVLKKLNQESKIVTILAGENGAYIAQELDAQGFSYISIDVQGNTRENIKVLPKEESVIELNEQGPTCTKEALEKLMNMVYAQIQKDDYIVFTGSIPKGLAKDTYKTLIERMNEKHAFSVLDASGENMVQGMLGNPKLIKPNLFELEQYFNVKIQTIEDVIFYGKKLIDKGVKEVLITMGEQGSLLIGEDIYQVEPVKVKAINTVGAGDSFLAGYLYGLENKMKVVDRLAYATACAVSSVLHEGTGPKSCEDVESIKESVVVNKL